MYVIDLTHYLAPSPRSEAPPASSPNSSPPWWPTRQTAFALTRRPDRLALSAANAPGALSLLSESLRDPDVTVRATLRYSPDPNPVQRQSFARAYLEADRPADALRWLQDGWGHLEDGRLGLRAEALEKLG